MVKYWPILLVFLLLACTPPVKKSDLFEPGQKLGTVSKKLEEASGLVASIANPGMLWSHNDSGNPAEVFLIDQKANIVLTITLKGISNRDFEDISMGAGPKAGVNYIYLAEIGDNLAVYPEKYIYRFEEPVLGDKKEIVQAEFDTLIVKLSDQVRDTETLMNDPLTQDMFIVSKREESVILYHIPAPFEKDTLVAEAMATLPFHKIIAGDISRDGKEVIMKDYGNIYYWKKKGDESIVELLKTNPEVLEYEPEPQGESICWKADGSGFYTLSETVKDKRGKLIFYERN